ncbi:tRNA (guanosine(18)-2'-O)-methyltransferase TrmH [Ningiella sp. W23]|uniref:tRNA (guanosine(18)-2'-O)-methyltransferase TrmH n=1 Tax=Ningiella sp. W23 TaxID=3023715 RepID=UPI003757475D
MSPERYQKIRQVLAKRQPDLTLLLEEVHKPHNVSAVIRSADAVGIHKIHAVWEENRALRKGTAMGSQIWVKTQVHRSTAEAVSHLKANNMQVLVTHLDDKAVDFREIDYTQPTAILLGQEKSGATSEAIALADQSVVVPMVGMVQSLNVSVAAALILYEAQRQREAANMYAQSKLDESEAQDVLFEGGFPVLYRECVRRKLPFPQVDDKGCISADKAWWDALQFTS